MPYNPSTGTLSNKPFSLATGVPTDGRTYFYDTVNFKWRPFVNTAEVLSYLDTSSKRTGHFGIIVNTGGSLSAGVITGGTNDEYWFKDAYADGNLVKKWDVAAKQDALVSGSTIKTVNGNNLLGAGNIVITGGSGSSNYNSTVQAEWVEATTKADGSPITDADVNNILFSKVSTTFYKRSFTGPAQASWWGANGFTNVDQYSILQQAINDCINERISVLHIGRGVYNLSEGLVIRKQGSERGYVFLSLEGDENAFDPTVAGGTTLNILDPAEACIYIQRGKGITIRNFQLTGQNVVNLSLTQVCDAFTPKSSWAAPGVSLYPTAPHAAIVIDGFYNSGTTNKYTKKAAFYNEPTRSGSTQIKIENIYAFKFGVGICISPAGMQNGENIFITNFWAEQMYASISTGDSQNRTVQVKNYSGWQKIYVHFDSKNFTPSGSGCPPFVDGFNIAGGSAYLCLNGTWYGNSFSAQRGHAELLGRIGGDPAGQLGKIMLTDCNLDMTGSVNDNGVYMRLPNQMVQCKDFVMHGGRIVYYGLPRAAFGFSVRSAYLVSVQLTCPILLGVGGIISYKLTSLEFPDAYFENLSEVQTSNVNATILSVDDSTRTWTYNSTDSTIEVGNYVVLQPKNNSDLTGEFTAGNVLKVPGGTVLSKVSNLVTVQGIPAQLQVGQNFDIFTKKAVVAS